MYLTRTIPVLRLKNSIVEFTLVPHKGEIHLTHI